MLEETTAHFQLLNNVQAFLQSSLWGKWVCVPLAPYRSLQRRPQASASHTFHERDGGQNLERRCGPLWSHEDDGRGLDGQSGRANKLATADIGTWRPYLLFLFYLISIFMAQKINYIKRWNQSINQSPFFLQWTKYFICFYNLIIFLQQYWDKQLISEKTTIYMWPHHPKPIHQCHKWVHINHVWSSARPKYWP